MRLHLKIRAKKVTIPYDHQALLTGTIHKWLKHNEYHGNLALFSFSRLKGAKAVANGLYFDNETAFFISVHENGMLKKIIQSIQDDPDMFNGLSVEELIIQEDPDLNNIEHFLPASPIFIKRKINDKIEHILFTDPDAGQYLKETLLTKMKTVGISDDALQISFDQSHSNAGIKLITYNGIGNKASWCSVFIKGKPETKLFAWNVGLGNSTGIGFGAIK